MTEVESGSPLLWGHSENDHQEVEPLSLHLRCVASRCAEFARSLGCEDEAFACGLLHDLGKMGPPAQRRMRRQGRGIDHWSYGAYQTLACYGPDGVAAAACILGHHQGLGRLAPDEFAQLAQLERWREHLKRNGRRLSDVPDEQARSWLAENDIMPPAAIQSVCPWDRVALKNAAAVMADVRMLYSALVDADFLETESHFRAERPGKRYCRPPSPELHPEQALLLVTAYIEARRQGAFVPQHVIQMRDDLLTACRTAAGQLPGVFTLSAPTGSGKTLAMLAFALEHAVRHGLRRDRTTYLPTMAFVKAHQHAASGGAIDGIVWWEYFLSS